MRKVQMPHPLDSLKIIFCSLLKFCYDLTLLYCIKLIEVD